MKKSKKHNKKRHKSSSSSSPSRRSRSASKSVSKESSNIKEKPKPEQFGEQNAQEQQVPRPYKVNKFALGSMLFENRRTNDRLDRTEVQQADTKLKKIDTSGRQAVLLSAAINTVQMDIKKEDYTVELINGQYVKIAKPYSCGFINCQMRFATTEELTKHLKEHDRVQTMKNNQRAQRFMENL